jgi:hypothetical protein
MIDEDFGDGLGRHDEFRFFELLAKLRNRLRLQQALLLRKIEHAAGERGLYHADAGRIGPRLNQLIALRTAQTAAHRRLENRIDGPAGGTLNLDSHVIAGAERNRAECSTL